MATAAELFASLNAEEPHIIINSDRSVTIPEELKNIAVQYDHNIETVTFDCPRYWDGNDLSEMIVNINFVRPDKYEDTYVCKNVTVDSNDPNIMHFDWTISRNVTEVSGTLIFIVCVRKSYIDGETSQVWHSQKCDACTILPGLKCDQVVIPSDPEHNGVQVDYNQNDETAPDYIKNRPFYKESKFYSFPDADYSTPAYNEPNEGLTLYRISDTPIENSNFDGAIVTYYDLSEPSAKATQTLSETDYRIEQDDNGENLFTEILGCFYIFYTQFAISETITVEPGIYSLVPDTLIMCLESIDITLDIKQIDNVFIPPLNYASKEFEPLALNYIKGLHIDDASYLYYDSKFKISPLRNLASKKFIRTFMFCTNMTECNVYSIGEYKPTSIREMFKYCRKLTRIVLPPDNNSDYVACLDLINCIDTFSAFEQCNSLRQITKITNIKISLDFSYCPLDDATVDMLLSNLLQPGANPQTLTLRSDVLKKLTEEQLAKVPSGWTIQ